MRSGLFIQVGFFKARNFKKMPQKSDLKRLVAMDWDRNSFIWQFP